MSIKYTSWQRARPHLRSWPATLGRVSLCQVSSVKRSHCQLPPRTGSVCVEQRELKSQCYGSVSSACRQHPLEGAGGWVVMWFTYVTGDLEAGWFQLSHETCSITDCQRKEQNIRHTHNKPQMQHARHSPPSARPALERHAVCGAWKVWICCYEPGEQEASS